MFAMWLQLIFILPLLLLTEQKLNGKPTRRPPPSVALESEVLASSSTTKRIQSTSRVLQLTNDNFNSTVNAYDVVFVNFYADWCHFSKRLSPIFEEAAIRLYEDMPKTAMVRLARVDCVREEELSNSCEIHKFPTLRLYYHGHPLRREYRGKRSVDALTAYVQKQYSSGLRWFNEIAQLETLDVKRRAIIAFYEHRKQLSCDIFERLAERYKNDCDFYLRVGQMLPGVAYTQKMPTIIFRPDIALTHAEDEVYAEDVGDQTKMEDWIIKKCVPLVREVNFNNIEEIIEQGLPLLVLFHMPFDVDSVKDFKSIVEMQLATCTNCGRFNFVTVDGTKFEHSVRHMGKSFLDLPLIAIDSLKFVYPYSKFKDIYIPDHLKMFIQEFSAHQGRLKAQLNGSQDTENIPPLSTFKLLGPSKHRYSLVKHDEL